MAAGFFRDSKGDVSEQKNSYNLKSYNHLEPLTLLYCPGQKEVTSLAQPKGII